MKKMIGGQKLKQLGSSRYTTDTDYLINAPGTDLFTHSSTKNEDYVNAATHPFFSAIWEKEIKNQEISLNSLLELKAFSFVQHCQNFNFEKADTDEFDIKFLARTLEFKVDFSIVKKHVEPGPMSEVVKIITDMKR